MSVPEYYSGCELTDCNFNDGKGNCETDPDIDSEEGECNTYCVEDCKICKWNLECEEAFGKVANRIREKLIKEVEK